MKLIVVIIGLMVSQATFAQFSLRNGVGAAADGISQAMMEQAIQDDRARRQLQIQREQEAIAMERRIQQQNVAIAQQSEIRQIILNQQQMIAARDKQIANLADRMDAMQPLIEELRIYRRHPTWTQIVKTKEFSTWLDRQPADVKILSSSISSDDANRLLDLYATRKRK